MSSAEKRINIVLGALERCTKEYGYYEDEKSSLNTNLDCGERSRQLKMLNQQIQETTSCLQDVRANVETYYHRLSEQRNNITNMNDAMIERANKSMEAACGILGETWDLID